jgi:NDP-sugar pyrophosphorylase family protein
VHHFAEQIEDRVKTYKSNAFIKDNNVRFYISDERNKLLDTGGAISSASHMLVSGNPEQRFLVHNVDILSNIKIEHLLSFSPKDADAILLVSKRETTRYLVFNANMELVGWINTQTGEVKSPYESVKSQLMDANNKCLDLNGYHLRAFAGIHMIGTVVFNFMPVSTEKFSIIDFYLNNCTRLKILGYEPEDMQLVDVGKLDSLACAEQFLFDNR